MAEVDGKHLISYGAWRQALSQNKKTIAVGVLAVVFLGGLLLVSADYYPVALVNSSTIGARRFWRNFRAASVYHGNLQKVYGADEKPLDDKAIQAGVLQELIERELVSAGAKVEAGSDMDYLVGRKLTKYDKNSGLQQAAGVVYGLSYADFRSDVLIPQAEEDVLAGRLYLRGEKLEDWLQDARRRASVVIFARGFAWDGEKVVLR